jgi:hypothetical protein
MKFLPKFIVAADAVKFKDELQACAEEGYRVTHHAVALSDGHSGLQELYTAIMEKED